MRGDVPPMAGSTLGGHATRILENQNAADVFWMPGLLAAAGGWFFRSLLRSLCHRHGARWLADLDADRDKRATACCAWNIAAVIYG